MTGEEQQFLVDAERVLAMIVGASIRLGIHSSGSQNTLVADSKFERRRGARVDNVPAGEPWLPEQEGGSGTQPL